jgi:hypothetical protein
MKVAAFLFFTTENNKDYKYAQDDNFINGY